MIKPKFHYADSPRDVRNKPVASLLTQIPSHRLPRTSPDGEVGVMEFRLKGTSRVLRGRHGKVGTVEFGLNLPPPSRQPALLHLATQRRVNFNLRKPAKVTICSDEPSNQIQSVQVHAEWTERITCNWPHGKDSTVYHNTRVSMKTSMIYIYQYIS